jgi:leucine dehydrogenase
MNCFEEMMERGHEQVAWWNDRASGLRAIIAIHDTTLGPALGGCRMLDYPTEQDAFIDVLRLSRGMTYKAAVAGLELGGGKAVIIGDPEHKTETLLRSFGRFVNSLGGRYITAEDMNTSVADMALIREETPHVTGVSEDLGGSGDPGPVTAWGTFHGIRAALQRVYGSPDPRGRTVAIQGVGSVGCRLAHHLNEAGAKLIYNDIKPANIARTMENCGQGTVVDDEGLFAADCDVLAPCAVGAVINPRTIERIRAPIIAGAANNQLEDYERDAEALRARGILYVPDYVINAGGLINVYGEIHGWPAGKSMDTTARIYDTVLHVIAVAEAQGITTLAASNHIAEERIAAAANR